MLLGIIAGIMGFVVVGALTFGLTNDKEAGILPGIVAGLWAAWPFMHFFHNERADFFHPPAKRYNKNVKQVFAAIRQILAENTYNFGDKWHVQIADTNQRRIRASLRWTDEETTIEVMGHGSRRTERLVRLVELDVLLTEEPNDKTVVLLDFSARSEGTQIRATDAPITDLKNSIESAIGPGVPVSPSSPAGLSAPPWWLLAASALSILVLFTGIVRAVMK